jgi:hypothetical protein
MTAMGHGDPAWAAYYDNVADRLGFHDAAGDATGPLAYLVCGWYADESLDPLGSAIRSLAQFELALERLGWGLQGELKVSHDTQTSFVRKAVGSGLRTKDAAWGRHGPTRDASGNYISSGGWWPASTLFHGAAVDIDLGGATADGPPRAADMRVAFGATASEALAAIVAAAAQDADEERTVEALQLGVLHELDQPDGRTRLDVVLHAGAFGSLPGGPDETEQIWEPPVPAQPDPPATPGRPDAGVFANRRAAGSDFGRVVLDKALTTDAALYVKTGDAGTGPASGAGKVVGSKVVTGHLHEVLDIIDGGRPRPAGPAPRPGRWVEVKRPQPRFYHPVDPFVLVQGGRRSFKHGGDGSRSDDDRLPCRLSGFTVRSITADLGRQGADRGTVTGDQLLERRVSNGSVPIECDDLLRETVLLDPGSSTAAVTRMRGRDAGAGDDRNRTLRLASNWGVEQTAWWVTNDPRIDPGPVLTHSGVTGTLPAPIAITPRSHPWNPLHIDWRVEFTPSATGVSEWALVQRPPRRDRWSSRAVPSSPRARRVPSPTLHGPRSRPERRRAVPMFATARSDCATNRRPPRRFTTTSPAPRSRPQTSPSPAVTSAPTSRPSSISSIGWTSSGAHSTASTSDCALARPRCDRSCQMERPTPRPSSPRPGSSRCAPAPRGSPPCVSSTDSVSTST